VAEELDKVDNLHDTVNLIIHTLNRSILDSIQILLPLDALLPFSTYSLHAGTNVAGMNDCWNCHVPELLLHVYWIWRMQSSRSTYMKTYMNKGMQQNYLEWNAQKYAPLLRSAQWTGLT
jgi:hypothetical protein